MAKRSPGVDRAVALVQQEGVSIADAARRCDVTYSAAHKRLHPETVREQSRRSEARSERKAAKRAWDDEHRATCPSCGKPMGTGSGRADGTSRRVLPCPPCRTAARVEKLRKIRHLRDAEGLRNEAIAERLGIPALTVIQELTRMRAAGIPVAQSGPGGRAARPGSRTLDSGDWAAMELAFPGETTRPETAASVHRG